MVALAGAIGFSEARAECEITDANLEKVIRKIRGFGLVPRKLASFDHIPE
jgi:hypothetical protein